MSLLDEERVKKPIKVLFCGIMCCHHHRHDHSYCDYYQDCY